jgi:hypothetical protein
VPEHEQNALPAAREIAALVIALGGVGVALRSQKKGGTLECAALRAQSS